MSRRILFGLVLLIPACTTGPRGPARPAGGSSTSPSSAPSASIGAPRPDRWAGTIVSRTSHDLYVGGRCESDWRTTLRFRVRNGNVSGSGDAIRTSTGNPCPFPVAQLQIRMFRLEVAGTLEGDRLNLRLRARSYAPAAGADDLGGFRVTTLGTVLHLRVRHDTVIQRVSLRAPDQDRGSFASANALRLRCRSC
ncbi:MAG TPA: hypothetical protein VF984_01865 [Actinomycetota bacterium]